MSKCNHEEVRTRKNTFMAVSLLVKGGKLYCKSCNKLLKEGVTSESKDVPNWIKEDYENFFNLFKYW